MANFKTHIVVASVGSGLLSSMFLGTGMTSPREVLALSAVGTLGGILPDIDADHSSPTRIMFTTLAMSLAFLIAFTRAPTSSILEIWLSWTGVFLTVRYVGWWCFTELTVHRGIFHSLAAALFFWFLATNLSYYVCHQNQLFSWTVGCFLFFGYLVHLLLDEICSVDLLSTRLKASFGTALKVIDYQNLGTSVLMIVAACFMYFLAPSASSFTALIWDTETYQKIADRFFPQTPWFPL